MTGARTRRLTLSVAACFVVSFVAIAIAEPQPRLLWNASASAPIGLYYVDRMRSPARRELVAIEPEAAVAAFLARRRYVPPGIPLIKHIAALPGDRVCRFSVFVTINGAPVAMAKSHDRQGRPLPVWFGCRQLAGHELFLLNATPDSLDGRYFGITTNAGLIGRAHPLLTRDAPDQPLRWRSLRNSTPRTLQPKET
jgi:conjugative transfer signal peptidase TraF